MTESSAPLVIISWLIPAIYLLCKMTFKLIRIAADLQKIKILEEKTKLTDKHFSEIERIQKEQGMYIHNIGQYINTIGILLNTGKIGEARKLIGDLGDKITEIREHQYSTNNMLNIILMEKIHKAKKHAIEIQIHLSSDFDISMVSDFDLIAILGNLFDNAIEAASVCEEKKEIALEGYMVNDYHFAILELSNTFNRPPVIENNRFISVKPRKEYHGLGLESIRTTAERYGGLLDIEVKEQLFHVTLMLGIE